MNLIKKIIIQLFIQKEKVKDDTKQEGNKKELTKQKGK